MQALPMPNAGAGPALAPRLRARTITACPRGRDQLLDSAMRKILAGFGVSVAFTAIVAAQTPTRARDLGVPFEGTPGTLNAITDVPGVTVGHPTLISGEGKLVRGMGPVRTGVTVILPRGKADTAPVFAGTSRKMETGK